MGLIEALSTIQKELKAPKNQFNAFAKFNYRSCEDILEAVKPLLDGTVLTLTDDLLNFGDRFYVRATATLKNGEDSIEATAFARESDTKKGMDVAQITGSASSYARKYALNGLFLIDDNKDPDTRDNTKTKKVQTSKPKIDAGPGVATKPQYGKLYALGFELWPDNPEKEVKERVKGIAAWYRKGDAITKKEASELIENWDAAVEQYMEQKSSTPEDYGQGHNDAVPPPLEDIPG
jgi:hypothetical protein